MAPGMAGCFGMKIMMIWDILARKCCHWGYKSHGANAREARCECAERGERRGGAERDGAERDGAA